MEAVQEKINEREQAAKNELEVQVGAVFPIETSSNG
jgi:hypothetical protein